jgi:hypothetical protein
MRQRISGIGALCCATTAGTGINPAPIAAPINILLTKRPERLGFIDTFPLDRQQRPL